MSNIVKETTESLQAMVCAMDENRLRRAYAYAIKLVDCELWAEHRIGRILRVLVLNEIRKRRGVALS